MSKITQEIAQRIIEEYCGGLSTYELADKYGLWQTSVCNLIAGRTWPQCKRPDDIRELIKRRKEKDRFQQGIVRHIDAAILDELQVDVVIGSLLGDGNLQKLSKITPNSSFSKKQSKDRLAYLQWHYKILQSYSSAVDQVFSKEKLISGKSGTILERKKVEKYHSGYVFRTHQHPNWTILRKEWYPLGVKTIPSTLTLNPLRIAIWYFDDGSNYVPNRTAVLCTQSFTLEEADFLCQKLNKFNLQPTIIKVTSQYTGRQMPMLKFSKSSYDNLIHVVKPFMSWDCFKHKIEWRPAKQQWEYSGKFTLEQIKKIKELRKTRNARDIATMFNVHVNTIYAIVSGRSWRQC